MAKKRKKRKSNVTVYKRPKTKGRKRAYVKRAAKRIVSRARRYAGNNKRDFGELAKLSLITLCGIIAVKQAKKHIPVKNEMIKAVIPIALGGGLYLSKYGKNKFIKPLAISMVAMGLYQGLTLIPQLQQYLAGDDPDQYLGSDFDEYVDVDDPQDVEDLAGQIQQFIPELAGSEPDDFDDSDDFDDLNEFEGEEETDYSFSGDQDVSEFHDLENFIS